MHRSLDKVDGVTGLRIERTGSFRLSKRKLTDPVDEFRASTRTEGVSSSFVPMGVMLCGTGCSTGGPRPCSCDGVH